MKIHRLGSSPAMNRATRIHKGELRLKMCCFRLQELRKGLIWFWGIACLAFTLFTLHRLVYLGYFDDAPLPAGVEAQLGIQIKTILYIHMCAIECIAVCECLACIDATAEKRYNADVSSTPCDALYLIAAVLTVGILIATWFVIGEWLYCLSTGCSERTGPLLSLLAEIVGYVSFGAECFWILIKLYLRCQKQCQSNQAANKDDYLIVRQAGLANQATRAAARVGGYAGYVDLRRAPAASNEDITEHKLEDGDFAVDGGLARADDGPQTAENPLNGQQARSGAAAAATAEEDARIMASQAGAALDGYKTVRNPMHRQAGRQARGAAGSAASAVRRAIHGMLFDLQYKHETTSRGIIMHMRAIQDLADQARDAGANDGSVNEALEGVLLGTQRVLHSFRNARDDDVAGLSAVQQHEICSLEDFADLLPKE